MASIYLPNGNPIGTEKFAYKLAWMARLRAHAAALLEQDEAIVLGGDYNVIPEEIDCHDPRAWLGDALFQPESRRSFRRSCIWASPRRSGRCTPTSAAPTPSGTTRAAPASATTASASTTCCSRRRPPTGSMACAIDKNPRRQPKASDHTPVIVELRD